MNWKFYATATVLGLACAAVGWKSAAREKGTILVPTFSSDVEGLKDQLKRQQDKDEADGRLGQYIVNMMYKSDQTVKELSPALMQIMARNIVRDTRDIMEDNSMMKQTFIGAVQLESKFLRFSQSPTGPKGLSQTTKATFHAALKFCGLPDVHDNDVWDTDLSIIAGACYFKWLYVNYHDGYYVDKGGKATDRKICPDTPQEPVLKEICAGQHASVAYNQGEASKAIKDFLRNGVLSEQEPATYNGKVIFNLTTTPDVPMVNVPNIKDLPRATSPSSILTSQKTK